MSYTKIVNKQQYLLYCNIYEKIVMEDSENKDLKQLYEFIKEYDEKHYKMEKYDPIQILNYLISENEIQIKTLAESINLSERLVSNILSGRTKPSKKFIAGICSHFCLSPNFFYDLLKK